MTASVHGGTAKIYKFPAGGRAGVSAQRDQDKMADHLASLGAGKAVFGGSWYHDVAIQDAERNGKQ